MPRSARPRFESGWSSLRTLTPGGARWEVWLRPRNAGQVGRKGAMSETHGNSSDHHAPAGLPEPKTPMWLPAVGALLFLAVALIWGLLPAAADTTGGPAAASADA